MAFMDSFFNNIQVSLGGFHEPIVLKDTDEAAQNQIDYLEKHLYEKDNKLKLAGIKKGVEGEENVLYQLKHSDIGMYILRGIHVEDAQIDFVLVTRGWIYFIECKNWSGNLKICKDGTVLIKNGKKTYTKESPLSQNQRHMDTVKQRWRKKNSKVTNALFSSLFEKNWYKPLVVIANNESIIDVREASQYDKGHIVRVDQLVSYIKKDLKSYSGREPFSTQKEMKSDAESFLRAEKEYQDKLTQQKAQKFGKLA